MARPARKARADRSPEEGSGPLRRCLATGAVRPAAEMVRFVVAPGGTVVPDVAGRLPGRGFWLSASRDAVKTACARNLFARAARAPVTVPPDLEAEVERQLARRCLDLIGFARRAGQAAFGFEKAQAMLREGRAGALLAARDGAAQGRAKMAALAPGVPVISLFSAAEIGAAVGRDHAVHAVVAPGGMAEALVRETARLEGFRPADDGTAE